MTDDDMITKIKAGEAMGNVVPFPIMSRSLYDPSSLEILSGLLPTQSDRLTFLGSSELSDTEIETLSRILKGHPSLHAIRVLGRTGEDLVIFRGSLPNFRSF